MNKLAVSILVFTLIIIISSLVLGAWLSINKNHEIRAQLTIGESIIEIELADTPEKRTRGLSGRSELGGNQGMLFIFDKPDRHSFWMKDMNFAIDIIWIDEDKHIVDITKNALPESFPQTFRPKTPARYVLETNTGWADNNKIKIGDPVIW